MFSTVLTNQLAKDAMPSDVNTPQGAGSTATGKREGPLPRGVSMAYGPPVVGAASMLFFAQFYFLNFATDVLLLSPAVIGGIFALGRLWDALTDPLHVPTSGSWGRGATGRGRVWGDDVHGFSRARRCSCSPLRCCFSRRRGSPRG